jgi:hypothetical protein
MGKDQSERGFSCSSRIELFLCKPCS